MGIIIRDCDKILQINFYFDLLKIFFSKLFTKSKFVLSPWSCNVSISY
jgi:hypothetical protein